MIRTGGWKLIIVSAVILAFSIAILAANRPERAGGIADELIEVTAVSPENEGRLVIVSGTPQLVEGGVIVDEEAGLRADNAVYYSRVPYQKVYVLESRQVVVDQGEDRFSTVDDVRETEYYVVQDWIHANHQRDAVITNTARRYENPPAIDMDAFYAANDLVISGFRVEPSKLSRHIQTVAGGFTREALEQACGEYIRGSGVELRTAVDSKGYGMLSSGDEIGDVHVLIAYETLEGAEPVTVVGRQRGDRIEFEEDGAVSEAEQVRPGVISREAFLDSITSEDASSRIYGIVGLALGAILFLLSLDWRKWMKPKKAR